MRARLAAAFAFLTAVSVVTPALSAPARGKKQPPVKVEPAPPPVEVEPSKPTMPPPQVQQGPSGTEPVDGKCPENLVLVRRGAVLRDGPGTSFGVGTIIEVDRCLPQVNVSFDRSWRLLETELGKGGWLDEKAPILEFGNAPVLAQAEPIFSVTLLENALGQSQPNLLAPVVIALKKGDVVTVHALSDDGLFLQAAKDGAPVGWVLKAVTRRTDDPSQTPAGTWGWAPAPTTETVPPGSPDALNPLPAEGTPVVITENEQASGLDVVGATEDQIAEGSLRTTQPKNLRERLGILGARPVGRGLTLGVGLGAGYFYERFQSNAINDPIGNYRVDAAMAGPILDVAYRAPFGLVLGMRYQFHAFSYSDFTPAAFKNLPGPLRPPGTNNTKANDLRCPLPVGEGPIQQLCPIPSLLQSFSIYGGWRVYGAEDMDLDLMLAYGTELLLYGKPTSREPFSDLWYHGLRPTARILYRPFSGKFGALATELGMGVGLVIPMVLRPRASCDGSPGNCILRPQDVFEATYVFNPSSGQYLRKGYARPPPFTGFNMKGGYLFEVPFAQVELGMEVFMRYSAVFFTQQEGFGKRNRCCQSGFYDRASQIDLYVGPSITARAAL